MGQLTPFSGADRLVVEGESAPRARSVIWTGRGSPEQRCHSPGARFSFEQWGYPNKKRTDLLLHGHT